MNTPPLPSAVRGPGHYAILVLVVVAFVAGFFTQRRLPPSAPFRPDAGPTARPASPPPAAWHTTFVSTRLAVHAHAASLVALERGRLRAFWYAGTDEGTQDVTIQTSVFDPATARWSPERTVASRESTQRALFRYVKKLGNPVAARAADGSLQLFYVTVSLGGWAGSSLTTMTSHDDGETWTTPRRLITSPFLNLSTLVRGPSFAYADGTLGLPVHNEFVGKFGELLRFDSSGALLDKVRLSSGRSCLQPVVLIEDPDRALIAMRFAGSKRPRRAMFATTTNGGKDWTPPVASPLSNSNAALTGLVLPDGRLLLALNNSEDSRNALTLAVSADHGQTWRTIHRIEDQSATEAAGLTPASYSTAIAQLARDTDPGVADPAGMADSVRRQMFSKHGYSFEFSYPSLIRTAEGDFHLAYTWNEAFIKHVRFNQAWLDQRMK